MVLGIKTGPKNWEDGKRTITEDGAKMVEVWFDIRKIHEYTDMLMWLQRQHVAIGLHHWGLVDGQCKTNLSTNDTHIRDETMTQIKHTIDAGSTIQCAYVNIHPGAQCTEFMDFSNWGQRIAGSECTDRTMSERLLLEAAHELQEYAEERGVLLTIETLPGREAVAMDAREQTYDPGNTSLTTMQRLAEQGIRIANDLTHTLGQCAVQDNTPSTMWDCLMQFTNATTDATSLLHVNTVRPPFNGTDSHDGITADDFARDVFPSHEQLVKFLAQFKEREDVYVVPEPQGDRTQENYRALCSLIESL